MYTHHSTVRMYDTDAAGILYFGNQFRFIHDAFEATINNEGFEIQTMLKPDSPYMLVIAHAQSDYLRPLTVGDQLSIQVTIDRIGTTSFTLAYDIYKETTNKLVGKAKTVHVCTNKQTKKKTDLPPDMRNALENAV